MFTWFTGSGDDGGDNDDSDNTVAVVVITFTVTFIVSVTATTIITFIIAYVCVKRKLLSVDLSNLSQQDDLELQPNPAYGTSHKVTMDATAAYESIK